MADVTKAAAKLLCWIAGMKKLAFLMLFLACQARAEPLPPVLRQALREANLPESALNLAIVPLSGSAPRYHEADVPANPASLMKLVTTYSALELLGPAYRWTTELRANVRPIEGVLNGDLYLKGYGDPKLTIERVWLLLRELRVAGINEIRGDLVLDRSYFTLPPDRDRFNDDGDHPERPYLVEPDALMSNFKSLRLTVQDGGNAVLLRLDPPLPEVALENRAKVGPAGDCANWKTNFGLKVEDFGSRTRVLTEGSLPAGCSGERHLAVLDHFTYTASLFRMLWRELGGTLNGSVREGVSPADSVVLAQSLSPELPLVLRDINKYSNNLMARQLYLTLGAAFGLPEDGPDTASRAAAVVRRWLAGKNWNWPELVLENGSGLSRSERISARHLADLLVDAARGPWAAEFIASLPIVAVDGTMKKRLPGDVLAGEAHIKTGSLKDVRGLAGYVRDADGRLRVVVALLNHSRAENGAKVLDQALRVAGNRAALAVAGVAR